MKRIIKNIIILIITLLIILVFIISKNTSVQAADNGTIKLNVKNENFTPGGTVTVEILLQDQKQGISSFTAYFHYDENIFEKINSSNIESNVSEEELDSIDYGDETGKVTIYYNDDISNIGKICTINLKIKSDIDVNNITSFTTSIGKVEAFSYSNDNLSDYGTITEKLQQAEIFHLKTLKL